MLTIFVLDRQSGETRRAGASDGELLAPSYLLPVLHLHHHHLLPLHPHQHGGEGGKERVRPQLRTADGHNTAG